MRMVKKRSYNEKKKFKLALKKKAKLCRLIEFKKSIQNSRFSAAAAAKIQGAGVSHSMGKGSYWKAKGKAFVDYVWPSLVYLSQGLLFIFVIAFYFGFAVVVFRYSIDLFNAYFGRPPAAAPAPAPAPVPAPEPEHLPWAMGAIPHEDAPADFNSGRGKTYWDGLRFKDEAKGLIHDIEEYEGPAVDQPPVAPEVNRPQEVSLKKRALYYALRFLSAAITAYSLSKSRGGNPPPAGPAGPLE